MRREDLAKKITGIKRIGFDLDGTLYAPDQCVIAGFRHESYLDLAKKKKISVSKAKKLFDAMYSKVGSTRKARKVFGLGKTSQGELKKSIQAVNKCLKEDKKTTLALKNLKKKFLIDVISLNLKKTVDTRLKLLKLTKLFEIKLATDGGKYDGSAYRHWIKLAKCKPRQLAYVGDKLDNDVIIPRKLGIQAILLSREAKKPFYKNGFWTIGKLTDLRKVIE